MANLLRSNLFKNRQVFYSLLLVAAFGWWVFVFKDLLFGKLAITGDATSYYEHFYFYVHHLSKGVFPMWDTSRHLGLPAEFFLRRIGSYNPLYFPLILVYKLGFPFTASYLTFLAGYFFIFMVGFYLLCYRLFEEKWLAFIAYLLMLFSSSGTIIFDSFIMLSMVPIVWLFYFLVDFYKDDKPSSFVGITFSLMLIFTTYLPFYFLTMLITFCIFFLLLFHRQFLRFFIKSFNFILVYKRLTVLCLFAFIVSCLPGIFFYQEAATGNFVMPIRNYDSPIGNAFAVSRQTYVEGGILANSFLNEIFAQLRSFRLGQLYVPVFTHVLFLLSILVCITRRLFFLAVWGFFVYMLGIYEATPLYQWCYEHVFFFKYMRNFQYFLWLVILPIYVIASVDQFRSYIKETKNNGINSWVNLAGICLIHFFLLLFLIAKKDTLMSSYFTLLVSLLLFVMLIFKTENLGKMFSGGVIYRGQVLSLILFLLIIIQPTQVFHYLMSNIPSEHYYQHKYIGMNKKLLFPMDLETESRILPPESQDKKIKNFLNAKKKFVLWFGVKWTYDLLKQIKIEEEENYFKARFHLYDRVENLLESQVTPKQLNRMFQNNNPVVYVESTEHIESSGLNTATVDAEIDTRIRNEAFDFQVTQYSPNKVIIRTDYNKNKFLLYTDSYYPQWRAEINGVPVSLYRANVAFKGIVVPKGKNIIEFKFGEPWRNQFNWLLLILFYSMLIFLCRLVMIEKRKLIKNG